MLYPIIAPLSVAVWWVVTKVTGKAALGSVVAVVLVPIALLIDGAPAWEFVAVAGVCALIVREARSEHQADDSAGGTLADQDVSEIRHMQLLTPLTLGPRTAPNRIMFGPHVTNLGADDRSLTARGTSPTTSATRRRAAAARS